MTKAPWEMIPWGFLFLIPASITVSFESRQWKEDGHDPVLMININDGTSNVIGQIAFNGVVQ